MAVVGREDEGDGDGVARRGWCRAARENPDGSSSAKARWSQASCYSYNWASPPHARSRRERGLTVGGWTAVPGAGEWRAALFNTIYGYRFVYAAKCMAYGSGKEDSPLCDVPGFENCRMKLLRHVSFVDCPNKIDLIQESAAMNQHEAIQKFIQGTIAQGAPVVPISAQLKYNIDVICEYIVKKIPIPERNFTSPPNMIVIRSFDVNKPGSEVNDIKGGVAGGSILKGVLRVNQKIEVRPGIVMKEESGRIKCTPIYTRIVSLYAEQNELQFAVPGGLIGVGTTMDPTLTRADRLVGQVLGEVGSLPDVYIELEVNFFLLRRLPGVRTSGTERASRVSKLTKGEILMLNIGSMSTGAKVVAVKNDLAKLALTAPVCTNKLEKLALRRRIEKHWRLIGWGTIQAGITLDVPPCPL
ncbi:unnamed protein product [Miscanthus lutarioriparius]|uniref:Uncharacterized protein n=1 Tax=Miscanthus lutarioriparius TaxID=422564 RepID=A0A811Q5V6_9POAL|nr:unnamed protein product [Miscanthus lutarioriparius]